MYSKLHRLLCQNYTENKIEKSSKICLTITTTSTRTITTCISQTTLKSQIRVDYVAYRRYTSDECHRVWRQRPSAGDGRVRRRALLAWWPMVDGLARDGRDGLSELLIH